MFSSVQYLWPAKDLQGVALTQNVASAGNLILNGTYSVPTNTTINFITVGFVPSVSFTSINNLSSATFTVTGQQNNAVISETINGPNNNTVYTTQSFDIIQSVSVDMAVTGIS